jgi:hypothetical protein
MELSGDCEEDPFENELARKVGNGELRLEQALRRLLARRTAELERLLGHQLRANKQQAMQKFQGMYDNGAIVSEVRLSRATEDLLETYKRLTKPATVGRLWALHRWALVASTLSKLRCLANVVTGTCQTRQ